MTQAPAPGAPPGGVALLERAISFTLGSLHSVTSAALSLPTPCREWDLHALLAHLNDSLAALHEAIDLGHVEVGHIDLGPVGRGQVDRRPVDIGPDDLGPGGGHRDPAAVLVAALRGRAGQVLGAWAGGGDYRVSVGGCRLSANVVTSAGAVEVAVHGWDVARACRRHRPIPPQLAEEMLWLSPLLVTEGDRPRRFATPVAVPPNASPSDRLVAFLGRDPR
jgi:uncharacterized protein (TIGR03086 family)